MGRGERRVHCCIVRFLQCLFLCHFPEQGGLACQLLCLLLRLPLQQEGAGGAAGVLQQALNFVAPTLLVGGLELGLWNFAASSTQARPQCALVPDVEFRGQNPVVRLFQMPSQYYVPRLAHLAYVE